MAPTPAYPWWISLGVAACLAVAVQARPAQAAADPCEAGSSRGQGECAQRRLAQAESELRVLEDNVSSMLDEASASDAPPTQESELRTLFQRAQLSWREDRQHSCAFDARVGGGQASWQGMRELACQAEMTQKRVDQLTRYRECLYIGGEACE